MQEPVSRELLATLDHLPVVEATDWDWDQALVEPSLSSLEEAIAATLPQRRWFAAKSRRIARAQIVDALPITEGGRLLIVAVAYDEGLAELYQLALAHSQGEPATQLAAVHPSLLWIRTQSDVGLPSGVLYDPTCKAEFCRALLELFIHSGERSALQGTLVATPFGSLLPRTSGELTPRLLTSEQSNTSIAFGDQLILKLFRKIDRGVNPDCEISEKLTQRGFTHGAPLAGVLEFRTADPEPWSLAVLQGFVPNRGDAWQQTLASLVEFLHHASSGTTALDPGRGHLEDSVCRASTREIPPAAQRVFEPFLARAELLGQRTAEMHRALAAVTETDAFAPEPFSPHDAIALRERASLLVQETFATLRLQLPRLDPAVRERAEKIAALEAEAVRRWEQLTQPLQVDKIRCHGDYHLGQVLVTDDDYLIIDFEGEPSRPLAQRREKQLALRDVAGMVRSFHYAACSAVAAVRAERATTVGVESLGRAWFFWIATAFVVAYRRAAGVAPFVPRDELAFEQVFEALLLEKAVYELRYELNNRPDWVYLPLEALQDLLSA